MSYNLQPLITIFEGILDPDQTRWIVEENNPQLQSLLDKATSLQQLLDNVGKHGTCGKLEKARPLAFHLV